MNTIPSPPSKLAFLLGSVLLAAVTGCTTYMEQPPAAVYVAPEPEPASVIVETAPAPAVVVVQTESDFYQPLTPYGRWVDRPEYGRVWVPDGVAADWRPYSNGHWENTEAGWFWVSDEPWGWATYHYGRWDNAPGLGWYWVPQTQWAPAWVAWRSGGGYAGWAPLPPSYRMERGVRVEVDVNVIAPRSFVFVEQRRFTDHQRPSTVIVNNTEIINKTVIINHSTVVNKTVINSGPPVATIEKAVGHPVQAAPIKDLRRSAEAPVAPHRAAAPARPVAAPEKPVQKPVDNPRRQPEPSVKPAAAPTRPAAPSRPAAPPVMAQHPPTTKPPETRPAPKPVPSKPSGVRPTPLPDKPGTPQKPEPKDDKKKPDQS